MATNRVKVTYRGSWFWVIFWIIFFFPIALALLFTDSVFELYGTTYTFKYDGSRFWLCFWILIFFPVAFVLAFLNGFSVGVESSSKE